MVEGFKFQRVRIWRYGPQNRCNSLIKVADMVQLTRALMSSSTFCFTAKVRTMRTIYTSSLTARKQHLPDREGGSNFLHTPWNTIAPPIFYTHVQN